MCRLQSVVCGPSVDWEAVCLVLSCLSAVTMLWSVGQDVAHINPPALLLPPHLQLQPDGASEAGAAPGLQAGAAGGRL